MSQEQETEKVDQLALNRVEAIKFMQEEIARYFGNNGYLLEQEEDQLKNLCTLLHIEKDDYCRLRDMAKSELDNFRRDDVLGLLLERVDRSKFYFDAEKLSIRSSLADRWVEELKTMSSPEGGKICKDAEIKKKKRSEILAWLKIPDIEDPSENNIPANESDENKRERAVRKDVDALMKRYGFLEEKDHVDNQKHFVCLVAYILLMILAVIGLNEWQFEDIQALHGDETKYLKFTDSRDNKQYNSIMIGNIQWMSENLDYKVDRSVPSELKGGLRLYAWDEALEVCPAGWRLPTVDEWLRLINLAGGDSVAGRVLKSARLWNGNAGNDSLYFSALPAGYNKLAQRIMGVDAGNSGYWWTLSMQNNKEALVVNMNASNDSVVFVSAPIAATRNGVAMYSVRCVKLADKTVPIRKGPAIANSVYTQTINGDVEGFKDLSNVPMLKLPNGKKEQLYDVGLYTDMSGSPLVSLPLSPKMDYKMQELAKRPMFLQNSNVVVKRMWERVLTKNNNAWISDSIWLGDSVTVAGQYKLLKLNPLDRGICGADIDARLGPDSTVFIVLDGPCDRYDEGGNYQINTSFDFKVERGCNENCTAEKLKLVHRATKANAIRVNKVEE